MGVTNVFPALGPSTNLQNSVHYTAQEYPHSNFELWPHALGVSNYKKHFDISVLLCRFRHFSSDHSGELNSLNCPQDHCVNLFTALLDLVVACIQQSHHNRPSQMTILPRTDSDWMVLVRSPWTGQEILGGLNTLLNQSAYVPCNVSPDYAWCTAV